ncbi:hypothetical protein RF11_02824 [Thelohanellus kitauei]|uniref:Uncharacterized protein n=1 Tax=Thelohanellus kitauei TaxID=669202 RepID=A0A0C2MR37_THEKT|nr:hypothetical protein RF11_02824 [Thelohanellus kitauei]
MEGGGSITLCAKTSCAKTSCAKPAAPKRHIDYGHAGKCPLTPRSSARTPMYLADNMSKTSGIMSMLRDYSLISAVIYSKFEENTTDFTTGQYRNTYLCFRKWTYTKKQKVSPSVCKVKATIICLYAFWEANTCSLVSIQYQQ